MPHNFEVITKPLYWGQSLSRIWQSLRHSIPRYLLYTDLHYLVHKSTPMVFIQNQRNPFHTLPSCSLS